MLFRSSHYDHQHAIRERRRLMRRCGVVASWPRSELQPDQIARLIRPQLSSFFSGAMEDLLQNGTWLVDKEEVLGRAGDDDED